MVGFALMLVLVLLIVSADWPLPSTEKEEDE